MRPVRPIPFQDAAEADICPLRLSLRLRQPTPAGPQCCVLTPYGAFLTVAFGVAPLSYVWTGGVIRCAPMNALDQGRAVGPGAMMGSAMQDDAARDWRDLLATQRMILPALGREIRALCLAPPDKDTLAAAALSILSRLPEAPTPSRRAEDDPTQWRLSQTIRAEGASGGFLLDIPCHDDCACRLEARLLETAERLSVRISPKRSDPRWRGLWRRGAFLAVGPTLQNRRALLSFERVPVGLAVLWCRSPDDAARIAAAAVSECLDMAFHPSKAQSVGAPPGMVRQAAIGVALLELPLADKEASLTVRPDPQGLGSWSLRAPSAADALVARVNRKLSALIREKHGFKPPSTPHDTGMPIPVSLPEGEEIDLHGLSQSERLEAILSAKDLDPKG